MKINIKQEGGFIGMASKAKLDFAKLTDDEQKMLNEIADNAAAEAKKAADEAAKAVEKAERDLSSPASAKSGPAAYGMSAARDTFSYSLSMKRDGKKIDVVFDDTNAPSGLVELFQKHIES